MRVRRVIVWGGLVAAMAGFGFAFQEDVKNRDVLKQLQKDRIQVLSEIREQYLAFKDRGFSDFHGEMGAIVELEQAKLEAASSDEERFDSLQRIVEVHTKLYEEQEALSRKGVGTKKDLLAALAKLLAARIDVEKLRLKMPGSRD